MMATLGRVVRGLAAAVALAALLGGVPALLLVGVGWPLPTSFPDWQAVEHTFTQQGVPARMVVDVLALVCWTAWALSVVSFFVEAAAILRRRQPPSVPLAGPLQSLVGALVAVVAVAVLSSSTGRHATVPERPTPLAEVVARTVVATGGQTIAQEVGDPAAPGPVYVVRHRDTLWGIAQRELGDALRWRELFDLNRGRAQPDGGRLSDPDKLFAGWRLILPAAGAAPRPVPPATPGAAGAAGLFTGAAAVPSNSHDPGPAPQPVAGRDNAGATPDGTPDRPPFYRPAVILPASEPQGPRVPTPRNQVVDLPSGGLVALSFASGVATALGLERLRRRRGYRPSEPRPGAPTPEPVHALAVQLHRIARGGRTAEDDGAEGTSLVRSAGADEPSAPGVLVLGEANDGQVVRANVPTLRGLGLVGACAPDTLRALILEAAMCDTAAVQLVVAGEAAALGLASALTARGNVRLAADVDQALALAEAALLTRTRLAVATGATDRASLAQREPGEPLPVLLLVARAEEVPAPRLQAILEAGGHLGIGALVLGPWPHGVTVEVGDDGEVRGITCAAGIEEPPLRGCRSVRVPIADALNCLSVCDLASQPYKTGGGDASAAIDDVDEEPGVEQDDYQAGEPPNERPIRVSLLGGYRIDAGGTEVATGLRSQARELFAYVLLHPRGVSAAALADLLWPDADDERGTHRLHTAVSNLRSTLRGRVPTVVTEVLDWRAGRYLPDYAAIDADVWRFESALAAYANADTDADRMGALKAAVAAYGGDLLDEIPYEWVEPFRVDLRARAVDAAVKLAELRAATADLLGAAAALDMALRVDPFAEELHRRLIRVLMSMGRPDAARDRWRQLQSRLAEIDVDPEDETTNLVTELLGSTARRGRAART